MFTVGIVGYGVVGQRRHSTLRQFKNFKVIRVSSQAIKFTFFKILIALCEISVKFPIGVPTM